MKYLMISGLDESESSNELLNQLHICPKPRKIEYLGGFLSFKYGSNCYISDITDRYIVEQLNDELFEEYLQLRERLTGFFGR